MNEPLLKRHRIDAMITLTAISGLVSQDDGLSASFGRAGGTVGRADGNTLVLPDAERTISRVHARVVWRDGVFVLADQGRNPAEVNGRPLGPTREAELRDGDLVQIGGYLLAVSVVDNIADSVAAAAPVLAIPTDDFADTLSLMSNQVAHTPDAPADATPAVFGDFGMPDAASDDPFAHLADPQPLPSPAAAGQADVVRAIDFEPVLELGADVASADAHDPFLNPTLEELLPPSQQVFAPAIAAPPVAPQPASVPVPLVVVPPAPQVPEAAIVRPAATAQDLLNALAEGLGLPRGEADPWTPDWMRRLGTLVVEASAPEAGVQPVALRQSFHDLRAQIGRATGES